MNIMNYIHRRKKRCVILLTVLLLFSLIAAGCSNTENLNSADGSSGSEDVALRTESDFADMFSDRDYEVGYDETESAEITLKGDSASSSSDAVQISGSTVTITDEGTYIVSGTLNDGMLIVNAGEQDKLHLIFDGVTVNSSTSAAIYVLEADKVFITLRDGTTNTFSNGGTFTSVDDNNIDGCIFSRQDLTFNGSGSLSVSSPAGHGIVCKDDLVFTSGIYTIDSASHGLDANDSIRIANASFTINSGKDGFHVENSDDAALGFLYIERGTFNISAEGDGISAGSDMLIKDGSFTIVSGGGYENAEKKSSGSQGDFKGGHRGGNPGRSSDMPGDPTGGAPDNSSEQEPEFPSGIIDTGSSINIENTSSSDTTDNSGSQDDSTSIKGIKAAGNLIINGGTFNINSADDAVHSNASITVNGGTFKLTSGDDGFHADDTLSVIEGTVTITRSYEGLEGLHVDISGGTITISGGTLNITSSGDGIDSNGSLSIAGGSVTVCGPVTGDTSILDYDTEGTITGGTFIGTGAAKMAQSFSDAGQGVITLRTGSQSAETKITVTDSSGNAILTCTPALPFEIVIISSPELEEGETCTVTVGDASSQVTAE